MAENRQDRLLMRQRGAGTRQIKDLEFQLILPGVQGTGPLPPRERPSEESRPVVPAIFLPQRSPQKTPQPTLPLSQSGSSPSTINVQKRKPGRPPKTKAAPIVNQADLPSSIPTQSDGEGSVTKKRRVVSESSDQAKKISEGIAVTKSSETKESPPRIDQNLVSQRNDTRTVSPANLVKGRKISELASRALEKKTGLRTRDEPWEGENQLLPEAKVLSSAKHVSRVQNETPESGSENNVNISGQTLQTELLSENVTQPLKLRNEEDSIGIPQVEVNIKKRPTRRKRTFVGEIQRFADEATEVLGSGNSAAVADSGLCRVGRNNAAPKISKPRGRRRKNILSVIRQGSPEEEPLQGEKAKNTKSAPQSSQPEGFLEKQPRKRGRPKKIIPVICEGGDADEVGRGNQPSEVDIGEKQPQMRNPQENPSMESEEQPIHNINEKAIGSALQDISGSPRLDGSLGSQIVNLHGSPPLETKEQPPKESPPLGEVIHSSNKYSNAGPNESETGMPSLGHSEESKAQRRLPKKWRLQGDVSGLSGASYSSRLHGSEFDPHIVDPCDNLSSGTQDQSTKVSTFQGQTSYSPGIFYSALLGESGCNAKTVNPLKHPPLRNQEQAQRIPPPRSDSNGPTGSSYCARPSESEYSADLPPIESSLMTGGGRLTKFLLPVGKETGRKKVTNPNETATSKRLALLQRQTTKKSSKKRGDLTRAFMPALEGTEKEGLSRRVEVFNDELSTQPPQIKDYLKNQPAQSEAHPGTQLKALEKSKPNETEPPGEGRDLQTRLPCKKRGRRKKQTIPDAGPPSRTEKTKKESKAECRVASPTLSPNPRPISVYRLSCDRRQSATATADSLVCTNDKCIAAADVMAQICHEFAMKSHASANHSVRGRSRTPLKVGLKRKLTINEDGSGPLDGWLFQLDISDRHIASSTQADKMQDYGKTLRAELDVHEPKTLETSLETFPNVEKGCAIKEPEYLTALLKSIETAVIQGRELDSQHSVETAGDQDQMLNIQSLEMMLQHSAKGIGVGEVIGTGNSETLKEFNGVLERAIATW